MRQLSGTDAFHVLAETSAQHMHTLKIAIIEPQGLLTYEAVRGWAAERLTQVEPLRWRLVPIPLRLARPVWVDQDVFDLDYHVGQRTIASPGGASEFDAALSQLASEKLDRHHPLWQVWYIDGHADGTVAVVFKLHHSLMDGGASVHFLETVFEPEGETISLPDPVIEAPPSRTELLRFAARHQVSQWKDLPSLARRTVTATKDNRARKADGAIPVTNPMTGPGTRFDKRITADRVYVDVTLPFSDVLRVKTALQCTVNDLFVAVCGGAIRRYLAEHGELPDIPLTATAPVSLRTPDEAHTYGNNTSVWAVNLGTDVDEPLARLAAVRRSVTAAREWATSDRGLLSSWQDHYALFNLLVVKLRPLVERGVGRPAFNAIISNVRGPRPLRLRGAPVIAVRSMGPIVGSQGLNLTAWSYRDTFSVGLHACRQNVPDLRRLADLVADEFATFAAVADALSADARAGKEGD